MKAPAFPGSHLEEKGTKVLWAPTVCQAQSRRLPSTQEVRLARLHTGPSHPQLYLSSLPRGATTHTKLCLAPEAKGKVIHTLGSSETWSKDGRLLVQRAEPGFWLHHYDLSDQPWCWISSVENGPMIPASTIAQGCAAGGTVVRDSNNVTEERDGPSPQSHLSPRAERVGHGDRETGERGPRACGGSRNDL